MTPHGLVVPPQADIPSVVRTTGTDKTVYTAGSPVNFPEFTATSTAGGSVTVDVVLRNSKGVVSSTGTLPGTWTAGTKTFQLVGSLADVNDSLGKMVYTADASDSADIIYTLKITDSNGNSTLCDNDALRLVTDAFIKDYIGACSGTITLATGTSGSNAKVIVTNNTGGITEITGSTPVNFITDLPTTVAAFKTAADNETTTPQYTITDVSGATFKVCAPKGLGDAANNFTVSLIAGGSPSDMTLTGDTQLNGGVTGVDIVDLLRTAGKLAVKWGVVDLAAQLLANQLLGVGDVNESQIRIDFPKTDEAVDQIRVRWQGRNTIAIPDIYDPVAKTYSAAWDLVTFGTPSFTDNPAWCLLDFISNSSFGLAREIYDRMSPAQKLVFHQDILDAAQRCDETIHTQFRYTLNALITNKKTNIEILQDIAGVMHSKIVFLPANIIRLVQDRPRSPVLLVNQSGIANEGFSYSTKSQKTKYDQVHVSFFDPDFYSKQVTLEVDFPLVEVVRDTAALDLVGWGIDTENQAIRHARKTAFDENQDIITVKYLGALDHFDVIPGDVIRIMDEFKDTGVNTFGGRIASVTSSTIVVMDRDLSITGNPTVYITMPDGTIHSTTIVSVGGTGNRTITLTDATPLTPAVGTKINITNGSEFSVTKVTRRNKGVYEMFGIPYDPVKYTIIDDAI